MTTPVKSKYRTYPTHTLDGALRVAKTIQDAMAGKPMHRLLLADALKIRPSSSNFRALLSSSLKYGFTGTEKADEIVLTDLGAAAVAGGSAEVAASRQAAMKPSIFGQVYSDYSNNKVPSAEMFAKILTSKYGVPEVSATECAEIIVENGERVGLVRQISGVRHVILSVDDNSSDPGLDVDLEDEGEAADGRRFDLGSRPDRRRD